MAVPAWRSGCEMLFLLERALSQELPALGVKFVSATEFK